MNSCLLSHPRTVLLLAMLLAAVLAPPASPAAAQGLVEGDTATGTLDSPPIAAGAYHTCALTPDGKADCWGANRDGQADDQMVPYTAITAGGSHTCGLTPDGKADCWGSNYYGQAEGQEGPYTTITAGGSRHTCGLTPDGKADCWGHNDYGQADDQEGPYTTITAGGSHTCALTPDGKADCWGNNGHGQAADQEGPYTTITAGDAHTCALTPDRKADCWGNNGHGQAADQEGPYTTITAGGVHTCALTSDGKADCWGNNYYGQAAGQEGPYATIAAGGVHTCGLTPDGAADCWGYNYYGQAADQAGPFARPLTLSSQLPEANAAGWHNSPVEITYTCTRGLRISTCPTGDLVEQDGADQQIIATAADLAGEVTVTNTINLDTTSPTITSELDSQANSAGWHNTPVTVTFTCSDTTSGIATCPETPVAIDSDGISAVEGVSTDIADNTATAEVTINLDTIAPTITSELDSQANSAGWHKTPVTVTFTCSDTTSGIATCQEPVVIDSDGISAAEGVSTDLADNVATAERLVLFDSQAATSSYTTSGLGLGIAPTGTLSGTATDETSGVTGVTVTLAPADGGAAIHIDAELDCDTTAAVTDLAPTGHATRVHVDTAGTSCSWTVDAPPGIWQLFTSATDLAGNVEDPVDHGTVIIT